MQIPLALQNKILGICEAPVLRGSETLLIFFFHFFFENGFKHKRMAVGLTP